jgi:prophage DNA circulation protein
MSWFDQLQQASFRGVPFGVLGSEGRFGRRVATHQYPNRDKPYIEDLGRSTRRITLTGFLVENSLVYGGGDAFSQRDAMVAAAETSGPGTLVHPTLGELQVSIPDGGLSVTERWDHGRYFEIGFTFIESGERQFPSASTTTPDALNSLADALDLAAAQDFVSSITRSVNLGLGIVQGVINLGSSVVGSVVDTVAGFVSLAGRAARDATSLFNLASLLTGNYGRYVNANVSSAFAGGQTASQDITIGTLETEGAQDRAAVAVAESALSAAAAALDASSALSFTTSAQGLTAALGTAVVNPGDALRLFSALAVYAPQTSDGLSQTAAAEQIAQLATGALLRRAAIGALARAIGQYAPSSYDDAAAVRSQVTNYLDAEILIAGDAGDDASYGALRALRQMVVALLIQAGSGLPRLQEFSYNAPLPALTLAQRIYADASRAAQLIDQAKPVHPAFMPPQFQALAN